MKRILALELSLVSAAIETDLFWETEKDQYLMIPDKVRGANAEKY